MKHGLLLLKWPVLDITVDWVENWEALGTEQQVTDMEDVSIDSRAPYGC
jgi:hypothetical protein